MGFRRKLFTLLLTSCFVSCLFAESVPETEDKTNEVRDGRMLNFKKKYYPEYYKKDLMEGRSGEEFANEALDGVYTECLPQLSFPCLQKKVLTYINRMNRMEKINLLGSYLSVVRTADEYVNETEFSGRMNSEETTLDSVVDNAVDKFFNSHILRLRVPSALSVFRSGEARTAEPARSLDFRFPYVEESEARKKGGGMKMGKKMMMMMMMGVKAKLMMLGPMMMGLTGLMAMKAMIAAVISLTISKIMILKKLMSMKNKGGGGGHSSGWESSGGGGGGGWSSGGGSGGHGGGSGGWDRRSVDEYYTTGHYVDAGDLAYRAYNTLENIF